MEQRIGQIEQGIGLMELELGLIKLGIGLIENMAPAHPHATGVAMYPALFSCI